MKKLLFVYDKMMVGGTTTALNALLRALDYKKYSVDLLLYKKEGLLLSDVPTEVNIIDEAHIGKIVGIQSSKIQKILISLLNGSFINIIASYIKHKGTNKGNFKNIAFHYLAKNQVHTSRKIEKKYNAAIGFIEGWSNHYVLSSKINADRRIVWIHPDYCASYLIPEVDRDAFNKADNIVVVSSKCRENFCKCFPEYEGKAIVIENIVSQGYLKKRAECENINLEKHKYDFCTVCRCDATVKGLDRMINVLARLKCESLIDGVHWHLIGDGKDLGVLKEQAEEKGLSENITFYGHKDNPLPYLIKMDMFVLPSRYEGKPVSVDEALCVGIPCIVTEYVSAREQVTDGINGLVVENSEDGLYCGLKKIIENDGSIDTMKNYLIENSYENSNETNKLYGILGD